MARPINIEIREKKRNDILNIRHEAYFAKGYDHVSVQDIVMSLAYQAGVPSLL